MTNIPKTVFIVSHTHWDREWYKPFHRFRVDLTRIIKRILDTLENDDDFRHFLLDGQAVVLEDHLEVHPEDERRIERLVKKNALSVGPWYVLPDELLVSAESTVRNLQIGHTVAGRFGRVQKVGYMPDSFGHIAQMPQILRLAGIDSFIFSRGSGDEIERTGHEFVWQAPDGSEVLAVNQCKAYDNAAGLGLGSYWEAHTQRDIDIDLAVERVRTLFEEMGKRSKGDVYLLNNGGDHIGPQREFGAILRALRDEFPATRFIHSGLAEYVDMVNEAGIVEHRHAGEMVHGRYQFILSGVWSARMYLKQLNDRAQTMLSAYAEPLAAYGHFLLALPYPHGIIQEAWKLLLKNHPHDSICGCSTDEVHGEMVPRFEGVIQTSEQVLRHRMIEIAPTFAKRVEDDHETVLCVANPLPRRRTEVVERLVVLPNHGASTDGLVLRDESGCVVPYVVVDKHCVRRFWGVDYRVELFPDFQRKMLDTYLTEFGEAYLVGDPENDEHDCFLTIQFLARDLPALGHALYFLGDEAKEEAAGFREALSPPHSGNGVVVTDCTIENEHIAVTLHDNGTFDVRDKRTGREYPGLNRLEDTEDVGDEYDYSTCASSKTVTSDGSTGIVRAVEGTGLRGRLEAITMLELPESIGGGRDARSERTVDCRVTTVITLDWDSPLVNVELRFANRSRDHRLRTEFPTTIRTDTIVSDGHFYSNHRPIRQPDGEGWMQRPPGTYPQQDFSLLQDGDHGLAVLNRGLPEIAATRDIAGNAKLSLTLLRAVGWLSRDDFETRSYANAGPTLYTPDAQCLGERVFHYAVVPFEGDYVDAGIKQISQRYRAPVVTIQGVADSSIAGGKSLVEHASKYTCVSAIKKHAERDTLVIRLFNLRGTPTNDSLTFGSDITTAWRTDLLEERVEMLTLASSRELVVALAPHEIVTVEVDFAT